MTEKTLILGTAQWGWNVGRDEAFRQLDAWLQAGGKEVDAATNYPINKNPADFRASEKILLEYIQAHGLQGELAVTMKVGALNNMRTPDVNLSPSFILMMGEEYLRVFRENLRGIMIHWDNRKAPEEIEETLLALIRLQKNFGLTPGLSGIAHPEVYGEIELMRESVFDIEFKHNLLHTDFERYSALHGDPHRFLAYGINAGGLKLDGSYSTNSTLVTRGGVPDYGTDLAAQLRAHLTDWNTAFVRPPVKTMNHLGLIFAALHPRVDGLLIGVSNTAQLTETLDFWKNLPVFDYEDIYRDLVSVSSSFRGV